MLVDSTGVVERAWARWAAEQDVSFQAMLPVLHGRPGRELIREFAPHLDAVAEAEKVDRWESEDPGGVTAVPGSAECIAIARTRPWAIVTSGPREHATARLRAVGHPLPPVFVTADDVTHGKPDPEPYLKAKDQLGISDGVVVEDAPAGIAAARGAGLRVLAVTTTHKALALQDADRVLPSMHEVSRILRAELGMRARETRSP